MSFLKPYEERVDVIGINNPLVNEVGYLESR